MMPAGGSCAGGTLLRRLGPPRGQPDCPRCHRDGQGRPGPGSGPAAARRSRSSWTVEGIRGRSGSFSSGLGRAVARRSLPRSKGTGPRQRTRPRPTPAWSSFTSPARRVDHQLPLRRRSGAGCPPRPTAPRKWTTHTGIPIRRGREQSNDRRWSRSQWRPQQGTITADQPGQPVRMLASTRSGPSWNRTTSRPTSGS